MSDLPETIRAFIAVPIPDAVRVQVAEVQRQLQPLLRDVSWTRPESMHLTLQFLGNIKSADLPNLQSMLHDVARRFAPFELALGHLGSFSNRVVWIGLQRGELPLTKLAEAVRCAAKDFAGHKEARGFNAHVTLGRMRRPAREVNAALQRISVPEFDAWTAAGFELIRSELSPHGSRYTTLATILLPKQT
jgi:2'-5' RNA ligase